MSTELRVPKFRITVELAVLGSDPRRVDLFIAEHRADSHRRQSVIDLLDGGDPFLPATEGDETALYNKDSLTYVSISLNDGEVPVEEATQEPEQDLFDRQVRVVVELMGGRSLDGELLYSPPPGRARVVDHLNTVHRFIRLWTSSRVYLVNKNHVLRVVERASTNTAGAR